MEEPKVTGGSLLCAALPADDWTLGILNEIAVELGLSDADRPKHGAHVTLMYDNKRGTDETNFVPDPDRIYQAKISGFKLFGDKENPCLVLTLASADLTRRHNEIQWAGHKHTFPYAPHVTLAKKNAGAYAVRALDVIDKYRFTELAFMGEYITEVE
jgi:2'-5' RNA ligase